MIEHNLCIQSVNIHVMHFCCFKTFQILNVNCSKSYLLLVALYEHVNVNIYGLCAHV